MPVNEPTADAPAARIPAGWRIAPRRLLAPLAAALALLWANLPLLVGGLLSNPASRFGGFFIFEPDGFSYLAKMRQGAAGAWLFTLPYTTEFQQGAPVYFFYLLLGKLAALFGLEMNTVYQIARLVGSLALFWTAYQLLIELLPSRRAGRLAWLVILWGGGASWLMSMLNPRYVAFASVAPDAFLYSALYGPPHIVCALALLLALVQAGRQALAAQREGELLPGRTLALGAGGLALGLMRESYYLVLVGVLAAYWLALSLLRRRAQWMAAQRLVLLALPGGAYALLLWLTFRYNPTMAAWAAQNPFGTPPLDNVLAGLGLTALPALLGIVVCRWWRDEKRLLVVAWAAALPLMLALPLGLERRLVGGATVALALPAAAWLHERAGPWLAAARWRKLVGTPALALYALLWVSYPLLFSLGAAGFVAGRPETLFISADEQAALDWLAGQPAGQVVLSAEQTGARIPAYSDARPVLGHPVETLDAAGKRAAVARFYSASGSAAERQALLAQYEVDLVWLGPAERALGGLDAAAAVAALPNWGPVYRHGCVQIWAELKPVADAGAAR